jgi:Rrf2 family protein
VILPQTAEYALRAMAHLALLDSDSVVSAGVLAEQTQIPVPYLSKILLKLVNASLLSARRGPGGGFTLAHSPENVTFQMILQAVDYQFNQKHCAFGWGDCSPLQSCPLHESWSLLKEEFHQWAQSNCLANVTKIPGILDQMGIPGARYVSHV